VLRKSAGLLRHAVSALTAGLSATPATRPITRKTTAMVAAAGLPAPHANWPARCGPAPPLHGRLPHSTMMARPAATGHAGRPTRPRPPRSPGHQPIRPANDRPFSPLSLWGPPPDGGARITAAQGARLGDDRVQYHTQQQKQAEPRDAAATATIQNISETSSGRGAKPNRNRRTRGIGRHSPQPLTFPTWTR